jgi:hypothetical protein
VFTASAAEIAAMDVAVGPCVDRVGPRGGRVRPIASRWDQNPDRVDHLQALFEILVPGDRGELVTRVVESPPGTLLTLSPAFAAALRPFGTNVEPILGEWLARIDGPKGQQIGGLLVRLQQYEIAARLADVRQQELYCWSGPEVPIFAIASGRTAKDYEEYRRATGRR